MVIDFEKHFLQLLIQQDEQTFNTFYLQTVDIFFRYIQSNFFLSKEDSEDVIGDFYVKFWNAVGRYDMNQNFSGYVWTIFKNTLKDHFKKNSELSFSTIHTESETPFEDTLVDESDMKDLLEKDFQFKQIEQALQHLDNLSREIIYFRFIEEKSYEDIANNLTISQDTLRQRLSRAIKALKKILENEGGEI